MSDGANLNMTAQSSMKAVLGGEEPTPLSDEDFETMIRQAPLSTEYMGYNAGANATARLVLETYERYPQTQHLFIDHDYLRDENGEVDWNNPIVLNVDLWDVLKKLYPEYESLFGDLTGFMWGWAVNAARHILNLGPVPNPALVTFEIDNG